MAEKSSTAHSEYGYLSSLLLHNVENAFVADSNLRAQWKILNYTAKPELEEAISEYKSFVSHLSRKNVDIHFLPGNQELGLDALYCRDASISTDYGMIICNMGKSQRSTEPEAHRRFFEELKIPILGGIKSPGTLEGGDTAWIDRQTLAVGHSYRTNREGIKQLRAMLPSEVEIIEVDLPHYKGPADVFHLMSVFSPVDHNIAVVYSPLLPIGFRNELLSRGYHLVEVHDDEFLTLGCNVLATAPGKCIMLQGNPKTKAALRKAGCEVLSYKGSEISIKGGGGPTCLTRPIRRLIG